MSQTLQLECGCEVVASHPSGDRRVTCSCQRDWVVRVVRTTRTEYEVDEVQQRRSEP